MRIERANMRDLGAILDELPAFWGEHARPALHHPLLVHEFGDTALVLREGDGPVQAYLFGLLTPRGIGYIHLVAVREGRRREGLARRLYEEFAGIVDRHGATALKAYTQPQNERSIAFHGALGFAVQEVADYAGPGETRIVFTRPLR